jgi:hypothetical protein
MALTEHLRTGAPLTKVQAGQLMGFCTSHRDQSEFPNWEEMGLLAPRAKGALELSIGRGPFKMTTFKAILKTLESNFEQDPTDENAGFIKSAKSHEWAGIQLTLEGTGILTPDYAGVAAAGTPGAVGELGVGNWRMTYGRLNAEGDVLDPTRLGFSSLGVFCDPTIVGPGKWIKTGYVPGCDHPIHYSFVRPNYNVTVNGRCVFNAVLQADEYPILSFKSVYFRLKFEPKPPGPVLVYYPGTGVAAAPAPAPAPAPAKSISWMDAAKDSGGAGLPPPPPMSSIKRSDTVCVVAEAVDPTVARFLDQMKTGGRDSVLEAIMTITGPAGATTDFEKELVRIKDRIGSLGITKALREAETLYTA